MKNAVTLIGQLGETGLTMRYGFYRWKIVTEKLRAVKGERSRVSVYNAAGGFDAEHPGENDDRVTQLLEASKFEVHARIIDEQKRHRRTPDELVSSYCSTVEYVGERSENFPRPPPEKSTAPLPPSRRPPTQASHLPIEPNTTQASRARAERFVVVLVARAPLVHAPLAHDPSPMALSQVQAAGARPRAAKGHRQGQG